MSGFSARQNPGYVHVGDQLIESSWPPGRSLLWIVFPGNDNEVPDASVNLHQ